MSRYDAVVVGAGPGGAAAAAHLSRAGANVLLCDRDAFPRDKACGGGLTPRGVAALERLGIASEAPIFVRAGGIEIVGGGRSSAVAFPQTSRWPSHALVARRVDLDHAILRTAEKAGASVREGVRVTGPVVEDGICRGVRFATGEEVGADWVIAADGATSVVARGMGLAPASGSGHGFWYAALRGYFGTVEPRTFRGAPVLEFYPLRTPSGRWLPAYGWIFPLPGGVANVGIDIPHRPGLDGLPPLRAAYRDFVERMRRERPGFAGATEEGAPVGALLPEAMCGFRPGAPGLLCVGDAAGMITPYSGEGIVYALEGAEHAASAITEETSPTRSLGRYERVLWDEYGFQFRTALWIMKAMRKAPLARAAAAAGIGRDRAFRAAVRMMAYLIDDAPQTPSTVSRAYRMMERVLRVSPRALWR